jgi:hypothetical protein
MSWEGQFAGRFAVQAAVYFERLVDVFRFVRGLFCEMTTPQAPVQLRESRSSGTKEACEKVTKSR